jgi:hypothetical protein
MNFAQEKSDASDQLEGLLCANAARKESFSGREY